jgi:hypothetical protein
MLQGMHNVVPKLKITKMAALKNQRQKIIALSDKI